MNRPDSAVPNGLGGIGVGVADFDRKLLPVVDAEGERIFARLNQVTDFIPAGRAERITESSFLAIDPKA